MRSFFGLALAFAACALADYNTVDNDITAIGTSLGTINNDTNDVVPGVAGVPFALQVEVDAVKLDKLIQQTIIDTNNSAAFGPIGSLAVSGAILGLEPKIQSTLANIASKNATFGDLGLIVLSSLYQLKQDTDLFGKAVVAKLDPLEAAVAPAIIGMIDGYFNSAIVAYGGKAT